MNDTPSQPEKPLVLDLSTPSRVVRVEIISLEECKQYMDKFQLSDERILEIRNNMVGIVDRIFTAYLKNFE